MPSYSKTDGAESSKNNDSALEMIAEIARLKTLVNDFENSTSWRVTAPLRRLTGLLRFFLPQRNNHQQPADNQDFDAHFYKHAYTDVGSNPHDHFKKFGSIHGRLGKAPELATAKQLMNIDIKKKTILLVVHDSERAGTPILTYNLALHYKKDHNVIILPLKGGPMERAFTQVADVVLCPFTDAYSSDVAGAVLRPFLEETKIDYAIVNSIVSRSVLQVLAEKFIPSVTLIHEFAAYIQPKSAALEVQLWAGKMVFSANLVFQSNADYALELKRTKPIILPQGRCISPPCKMEVQLDPSVNHLKMTFRPVELPNNTIVILGAGKVEYRKGVDLFIQSAARVEELEEEASLHFVWAGYGYDPQNDLSYSAFIADQVQRHKLRSRFTFVGDVVEMDVAYRLADIFFLSSRLDPLPNVAIEAMDSGLPVICFDATTGIADLLIGHNLKDACVASYLDIDNAARLIAKLVRDPKYREQTSIACSSLAKKYFQMASYAGELLNLAKETASSWQQEEQDCRLLLQHPEHFVKEFYLSPLGQETSYPHLVRRFVRSWAAGVCCRKPRPGFHPGIFAELNQLDSRYENPLAAFIRKGCPDGPWLSNVLIPNSSALCPLRHTKAALHIHCFYPEDLSTILGKFTTQTIGSLDLLISHPESINSALITPSTDLWTHGNVIIHQVPNRGRDIGPLFTEFADLLIHQYAIIGHLHTKRSLALSDPKLTNQWVEFLLQHLVGDQFPMAQCILNAFESDSRLGLVFPEDPYVVGWAENLSMANTLAAELKIGQTDVQYFDFPVGNMFWARCEALRPLLERKLGWNDYPEEPVPQDGTMLHALERLLPFIVKKQGYSTRMTHVPGCSR